jgi:deazaflavin-dependent oxidoreductase (nitroreductase family)
VVTTPGAKSGKLRKNPVMRVTDRSAYPLVASKSGSDEQPQWHNLKADPDAVELKKDHLGQDERDDHDRPELRHASQLAWSYLSSGLDAANAVTAAEALAQRLSTPAPWSTSIAS